MQIQDNQNLENDFVNNSEHYNTQDLQSIDGGLGGLNPNQKISNLQLMIDQSPLVLEQEAFYNKINNTTPSKKSLNKTDETNPPDVDLSTEAFVRSFSEWERSGTVVLSKNETRYWVDGVLVRQITDDAGNPLDFYYRQALPLGSGSTDIWISFIPIDAPNRPEQPVFTKFSYLKKQLWVADSNELVENGQLITYSSYQDAMIRVKVLERINLFEDFRISMMQNGADANYFVEMRGVRTVRNLIDKIKQLEAAYPNFSTDDILGALRAC